MSILNNNLVERLLFTTIVIGILAILVSGVKLFDISSQLNDNMAYQVHKQGSELDLQSEAEARMLYASDLQRRKLVKERGQMYTVAGIGIALIGIGWLGYDFRNNRRKKEEPQTAAESA